MSRISNIGGGGSGSGGGGVTSFAKLGSSKITGDVTISAGSNITLTQVGQNITIVGSGSISSFARAVTLVVAASNAKDTTNADYFCTGSNDDSTIQTALNALPSSGGTVSLTDGIFTTGATITVTANQRLIGQGVGATTITSAVNTDLIRMGNRQSDNIMRNWMELAQMTVNSTAVSQTHANVKIDGGGRGTSIKRVSTGGGGYGFELMDLDRCYFEDLSANNPTIAGIFIEVGKENTYGTCTWVNCDTVLGGTNSTFGWLVDANADQGSPNAPDRLNFIGCMMFMSTGLTGCVGFYNKLQITSANFIGCLFEQNIRQYRNDGSNSTVNFLGCTFLDSNVACTDIVYLAGGGFGSFTFRDCRFQQATNGFNGASGGSSIILEGRNNNQGNITNLFAGSFNSKMGDDTIFAGDATLALGLNNNRFDYGFINHLVGNPVRIEPSGDGTQAINFLKADNSTIVASIDTTNTRFGLGTATAPTSNVLTGGAIATPTVAKSSAYGAAETDSVILVSGTTTITLPTAVGCTGRRYTVKKTDSGTTSTIATTSAQTIDGSTTALIKVQYVSLDLVSDGANWNVV